MNSDALRRLVLVLILAVSPAPAVAGQQTYESCSLIAAEYLTVLQLASRGLDAETLKASLPDISDPAKRRVDQLLAAAKKDGLLETYSTINSEYSACAREVYRDQGLPQPGTRERRFHDCAGENRVRYDITLGASMEAPAAAIKQDLSPVHHRMVDAIYRLYESEGPLVVFDNLAGELKHCLNRPAS